MIRRLLLLCAFVLLCEPLLCAEDRLAPAHIKGEVKYLPPQSEEGIPDRFKLAAHSFTFEGVQLPLDSKTIEIWDVTFPSPVKTTSELNNTVYCEYFCPKGLAAGKKAPGVIV